MTPVRIIDIYVSGEAPESEALICKMINNVRVKNFTLKWLLLLFLLPDIDSNTADTPVYLWGFAHTFLFVHVAKENQMKGSKVANEGCIQRWQTQAESGWFFEQHCDGKRATHNRVYCITKRKWTCVRWVKIKLNRDQKKSVQKTEWKGKDRMSGKKINEELIKEYT